MAFRFSYKGGVSKPNIHTTEKFLLFLVAGGNEVPLWEVEKEGLIQRSDSARTEFGGAGFEYTTGINVVKIFLSRQGFGIPRQFHSIYLQLLQGPSTEVTIRPFSYEDLAFFFRAQAEILTNKQALEILSPESPSRRFIASQPPLPVKLRDKIITIDRRRQKEGVRHIRIGQNGNV